MWDSVARENCLARDLAHALSQNWAPNTMCQLKTAFEYMTLKQLWWKSEPAMSLLFCYLVDSPWHRGVKALCRLCSCCLSSARPCEGRPCCITRILLTAISSQLTTWCPCFSKLDFLCAPALCVLSIVFCTELSAQLWFEILQSSKGRALNARFDF